MSELKLCLANYSNLFTYFVNNNIYSYLITAKFRISILVHLLQHLEASPYISILLKLDYCMLVCLFVHQGIV